MPQKKKSKNASVEHSQPNKSSSKKSVKTKAIKIEENKEMLDNDMTDVRNNSDRNTIKTHDTTPKKLNNQSINNYESS